MTFTSVTIVPASVFWSSSSGFALEALLILLALCIYAMLRLRGTTLVAPAVWAVISTACLLLIAIRPDVSDATRFTAIATTFCPLMAVLGAKRPQDKGWLWVVLTLWLVLVWPAGQALLMQGGQLQLFAAWKLFLVGLVALGLLNYLPTRNWFASLLVAAGQTVLLGDFVWAFPAEWRSRALPIAAACFLVASGVTLRQRTIETASRSIEEYTRRWLWFRDAYGAFWALRILGRVNQTAELRHWPMRLTWQRFELAEGARPNAEQLGEVEQTLDTLLRRFT